MRNIEIKTFNADVEQLTTLLTAARLEERAERGLLVARRLAALADQIERKSSSRFEAIELIRAEAERYENEAREAVR